MIQVDLRHKDERKDRAVVNIGIDLTEFYQSVEWDILSVPAQRLALDIFCSMFYINLMTNAPLCLSDRWTEG